jgi:hypothetical protein
MDISSDDRNAKNLHSSNKIAISDENELDYEEEDQHLSNELSINRRNESVINRLPNRRWIKKLILFYI